MKTIALISCIMLVSLSVSGMTGDVNPDGLIIVPNVEGISVALATQTLQMVGLSPRMASSAQPAAMIVRQEPPPGAKLPPGGEVVLAANLTDDLSRIASTADTRALLPPTTVMVTDATGRSLSTSSSTVSPLVNPAQGQSRSLTTLTPMVQGSAQQPQMLTLSDGQGTVFYQPSQPRISPYFTQSTTPRLYPAWYPKRLLTQETTTQQHLAGQSGSVSIAVSEQPPNFYRILVTPTELIVSQPLYPYVDPYQSGYSGILGAGGFLSATQPVGASATSPNPAVSMPNVLRLSLADATAALNRGGLASSVIYVDSIEGRPGIVVKQTPEAHRLIQSGSVVQLWIAR